VIALIVRDPVWLFLSVTVVAALVVPTTWFLNETVVGDTLTALTPLPLRETVCGLPLPSSVTLSVSVLGPSRLGVKVTEILQLEPGRRASQVPIGQVLVAT
jgi:hypothetical protein